jgi:Concanavalin A-like lectin/glucanases superfamily
MNFAYVCITKFNFMKKLILAFVLISYTSFAQNYVKDFNGSTSYVDLGSSVLNGVRSICFWFKPNVTATPSLTNSYGMIARDDNSNIDELHYEIMGGDQDAANAGKLYFAYRANLSTIQYVNTTTSTWLSTDWHHTCGTIDAVAGMKLYVDGNLEDINTACTTAFPSATEITALGKHTLFQR